MQTDERTQRCGSCKTVQPVSEFAPKQRGPDGFWCKACRRAKYRAAHPAPEPRITEEGIRCSKCRARKARDAFYSKKNGDPQSQCKACYREDHRREYVPKSGGTDEPRECAVCGATYQPKTRRPSVYCSRECGQQDRKESGRERNAYLLRTYGITADDYDQMLIEQGGGCALCGVKPDELTAGRFRTYLHVDHDHETNAVRGLLCPDHNLLLGRFGDSVDMFRKVVAYLEAHASL